jgi:galactarate dehydratase (D-threo-forming)
MVAGDAVDILNITAGSAGGIYEARKIAAVAEAAGISCVLGAAHEMSLGTSAQAHLGSTLTNLNYRSDAIGPVIYDRDVASPPLEYSDGNLIVPSGPGTGLEIDKGALEVMASF